MAESVPQWREYHDACSIALCWTPSTTPPNRPGDFRTH